MLSFTHEEMELLLSCLNGRAEQQRAMYGSADPAVQALVDKVSSEPAAEPAPVVEAPVVEAPVEEAPVAQE